MADAPKRKCDPIKREDMRPLKRRRLLGNAVNAALVADAAEGGEPGA